MGSMGRSRWVSVTASAVLGTVIRPTNLTLVSFPRIRDQLELRSCRLSQAIARNLEWFIFRVKENSQPFPLAQFSESWQLSTLSFLIPNQGIDDVPLEKFYRY